MMTGKVAIGTGMKDALTDPNWSLALQPVQVEVSTGSNLGYTRGTYMLTATDPLSKKVATERAGLSIFFAIRRTDRGRQSSLSASGPCSDTRR